MSDKNFALSVVCYSFIPYNNCIISVRLFFTVSMYETNVLLRTEEFVALNFGLNFHSKREYVPIINTLYFSSIVIILSMIFFIYSFSFK